MKFMQLTIDLLIYPESRLYHDFYMFYVILIVTRTSPSLDASKGVSRTTGLYLSTIVVLRLGKFEPKSWG
jgi:hypothetical protein